MNLWSKNLNINKEETTKVKELWLIRKQNRWKEVCPIISFLPSIKSILKTNTLGTKHQGRLKILRLIFLFVFTLSQLTLYGYIREEFRANVDPSDILVSTIAGGKGNWRISISWFSTPLKGDDFCQDLMWLVTWDFVFSLKPWIHDVPFYCQYKLLPCTQL